MEGKGGGEKEGEEEEECHLQLEEILDSLSGIEEETKEALLRHRLLTRVLLTTATSGDLRDLGIPMAQALLLKSYFKEGTASSSGGAAAATTTATPATPHGGLSPEVEKELADLLAGLKITPKTRAILAEHGYLSATALSMATGEKLEQAGIAAGQVLEIKSKFNNAGPASGSAGAAAASFSSPHSPMGSATAGAAAAAASVLPQPAAAAAGAASPSPFSSRFFDAATEPTIRIPPIFGIMDISPAPLSTTLEGFSTAGVVNVARAAAMALHYITDQVRVGCEFIACHW